MTWIKALGLFGVFLCCLATGVYYSNRLYKRATFLEMVEKLCAYTAAQIRYTCAPISDIWKDACVKPEFTSLDFLQCSRDVDWKENIYKRISVDRTSMCATDEDMQILLEWFAGLGSSDLEGQLEHCMRYNELLSAQRNRAKERAQQVGKLYVSLGFLGGVSAVLLLL